MESPNESLNNNEITFYISIISGMLLTISEVLPYVKSIRSNGIIEILVNFLVEKSNINANSNTNVQNANSNTNVQNASSNTNVQNDERTPLLTESNISSQVSNFTINSPNITLTFNSPNKITSKTTDAQPFVFS
jgi:hypothetical protein